MVATRISAPFSVCPTSVVHLAVPSPTPGVGLIHPPCRGREHHAWAEVCQVFGCVFALVDFDHASLGTCRTQCPGSSASLRPIVSVKFSTCIGSASKNGLPFNSPTVSARYDTDQCLIQSFRKPLQIVLFCQYHEVVTMVRQSDVFPRRSAQARNELSNLESHARQRVHDNRCEVRRRVSRSVHVEQQLTQTWSRSLRRQLHSTLPN